MLFTSLFAVAASASLASAHAFMVAPKPRSSGRQTSVSARQIGRVPGGPPGNINTVAAGCRDSTAGASVQTVAVGGSLNVKWQIVANHGDVVKVGVAFAGENTFTNVATVSVNAQQTNVKLPAGKTGKAVVQWLWAPKGDGATYVACSDITVGGNGNNAAQPAANTNAGNKAATGNNNNNANANNGNGNRTGRRNRKNRNRRN
ncbi:hypothetical protein HK105_203205 [Polyrhizophydium stewartii]|uniref:Chitin-binding type-4 domain-containing protein n=1 Tax=Polyrhizophydium stewartii TaxID=2732419 RepID=A0ABR4NC97_9FUNG